MIRLNRLVLSGWNGGSELTRKDKRTMSIKNIPIDDESKRLIVEMIDPRICPMCSIASPLNAFVPILLGCEDCGDHPGVICPSCNEEIDLIFYDFIHFTEIPMM